ncbi:MAG TPA: S9 family peptidase [Bryobacteraceae bacterium]|nr:S9 family peptidase [Bryobacteraceae bacterium]
MVRQRTRIEAASTLTRRGFVAAAAAFSLPMPAADTPLPPPPIAKIVAKSITQQGETRNDPYFWLRDKANPEVTAYLEAENAYFQAVMKPVEGLKDTLYKEMVGRIQETDLSVPERKDDYYYYTRIEKGQDYQLYCRKYESLDGKEELLLDSNALAKNHTYFRLGNFAVSPAHQILAYSTDTEGDEVYTTYFKDLRNGTVLPDQIPNVYYGLVWGNDNKTLFYTTLDSAKRPYRVHRHVLGTPVASDAIVFEEPDERFYVELSKTKDQKYVLVTSESKLTSEVLYLAADAPDGTFVPVIPRKTGVLYGVWHHDGEFLILHNDGAQNFELAATKVGESATAKRRIVIAHRKEVLLEGMESYRSWMTVSERENGLRRIRVRRWNGEEDHAVTMPEPVYAVQLAGNPNYDAKTIRFTYQSLVTPPSVFDYDMTTRKRTLRKQQEIPSGYDAGKYESERTFATASDGARIPVAIVYKKGFRKDGNAPLLLYAYGSYGINTEATFNPSRLSLLDRGFAFAIASIRGGSEMGRYWYETGKFLSKKNTFTDFVAAAEHLTAAKYTQPSRLAIMGGSAGGLLMGAAVNLRPDLFHTVLALVPFVDVLNTMSDATLPLTIGEYEEWGNPDDPKYYSYIKSYAPYENLKKTAYPNILATGGLNDPRVPYWEPAKWVAKMRTLQTGKNVIAMKINMGAGHFGKSGRYAVLEETAEQYAFLLLTMGITR